MSCLKREFVLLIRQFLDEANFKETVHMLERESGYFFNFKYFEEKILLGEWDEVDKYLSGFTKVDDNHFSTKIFFGIRKQKYLEALDRHDSAKAIEILAKDLKVFEASNEKVYKDLTQLLTLENIRESEHLSNYGDIKSARSMMIVELRKLMEANPVLREKLALPTMKASRLQDLISQSLIWQHSRCKNPRPDPDIETLLTNHICTPTLARNVESVEETNPSEIMEVVDPAQCRQVMIEGSTSKVARLLYTNSGDGILVLGTNGVQRLFKWSPSEQNPTGKATASVSPLDWRPNSGLLMKNDVAENPEESVPCIALSNNDSYVMSACGGKVSLFNLLNFKVMDTFMPPPPAATFLLFLPRDNNIAAIGMKDSTIIIYNAREDLILHVGKKFNHHQKHITGLASSTVLNILVSSAADGELCFWSYDPWAMKRFLAIQPPAGKSREGDTRVQFHNDQVHLLVSHVTQIAIYDASKMECIHKWEPQGSISSPITCASYSCNSQLVYASFADGNIGVFDAEYLRLRCRIAPSAYMHQPPPNRAPSMPLVIAAHPQEPNQIAVGFSDGSVKVLETPKPLRRLGVAEKAGMESGQPSCASAVPNN